MPDFKSLPSKFSYQAFKIEHSLISDLSRKTEAAGQVNIIPMHELTMAKSNHVPKLDKTFKKTIEL